MTDHERAIKIAFAARHLTQDDAITLVLDNIKQVREAAEKTGIDRAQRLIGQLMPAE